MADDNLTVIAKALASKLTVAGAGGLTAYSTWPDNFGATVPAIAIIPKSYQYDTDSGGTYNGTTLNFSLVLFAARETDGLAVGQAKLFSYLDERLSGSVKRLIDADETLGGKCQACKLRAWEDIRLDYVLTPNGPAYIGAVGDVEVQT